MQKDFEQAMQLAKIGLYAESLRKYQKIIAQGHNTFACRVNLGTLYLQSHQTEKALKQFSKANEIDPFSHIVHYNMMMSYLVLSNATQALDSIYKALSCLYAKLAKQQNSMQYISKALEYCQDNVMAYTIKGRLYYQNNNKTQALSNYNKAIVYHPEFLGAFYSKAVLYCNQKNIEAFNHNMKQYLNNKNQRHPPFVLQEPKLFNPLSECEMKIQIRRRVQQFNILIQLLGQSCAVIQKKENNEDQTQESQINMWQSQIKESQPEGSGVGESNLTTKSDIDCLQTRIKVEERNKSQIMATSLSNDQKFLMDEEIDDVINKPMQTLEIGDNISVLSKSSDWISISKFERMSLKNLKKYLQFRIQINSMQLFDGKMFNCSVLLKFNNQQVRSKNAYGKWMQVHQFKISNDAHKIQVRAQKQGSFWFKNSLIGVSEIDILETKLTSCILFNEKKQKIGALYYKLRLRK